MANTLEILSPGVFGFEKKPGRAPQSFSPAKMGIVGWTDQGPSNLPVQVQSFEDFKAVFGDISTLSVVPLAVQAFFATGGQAAWVSRVVPADAVAASVQVDPVPGPTKWTFTSLGEGTWGNSTTVRIRGNQNFLDRTPGSVKWDKFDLLVLRPFPVDPTIITAAETFEAITLTDATATDYLGTVMADPSRRSTLITVTAGISGVPTGLLGANYQDEVSGVGTGILTNFVFTLLNGNVLPGNYRLVAGGTQVNDQAQTPTGLINNSNMLFTLTVPGFPIADGTLKLFYAKFPSLIAQALTVTGAINGVNKDFTVAIGALGNAVYREGTVFRIRYAAVAGASPQLLFTVGASPATYDLSTTPLTSTPIMPGSVSIAVTTVANGAQVITDDGNGNLTNPLALAAPGTIDYVTGAMTGITLTLTALSTVVATYNSSLAITKGASSSNVAQGVALVGSIDGTGVNTINLTNSTTAPTTNGAISFRTFVAPLAGTTILIDYVRTGIINSSLAGVLTGDVNLVPTHTIDFTTGLTQFTTTFPPLTGTTIDATYQTGLVIRDNGLGRLIGNVNPTGVNTIDYATGAVNAQFSTPPLSGATLYSNYDTLAPFLDFPLTGGLNGSAISRSDISLAGPPITGLEATKKGIYALDLVEEPLNVIVPDFEGSQFVQFDLVQFGKNRADNRFLIMGFGFGTTVPQAIQYVLVTQAWDVKFGAIYYPNIYFTNPVTELAQLMPVTPFAAGIYAKTAHNKNVGKAPGGVEDGALDGEGTVGPEFKVELADRNALYQAKINPIISSQATGLSVWGVRTLSNERRWRYVNARTLHDYLMYATSLQLQWAVFENNGPPLWAKISTALKGFYGSLFRLGYFAGDTEAQAFDVVCNSTNNNQKTISQGKAIIDIGFAPNTPAEFIIFTLKQPVGQQASLV